MPDFNNFVYFVLVRNSNASYGFTGYTDRSSGEVKALHMGKKDHNGNDLPHRFKFDRSHRSLRIPKNWKDKDGNSVVEFLREFPECGGSSNGTYVTQDGEKIQTNMWFKEMNEGKDAEVALKAKRIKNEAETLALNMEGDELSEMAVLCGTMVTDEGLQKHRVVEYAGASPEAFLDMYKQPGRQVKALLRKAVAAGLVANNVGTIFTWEEITLGANEQLAISKLMEDTAIKDAIEKNLSMVSS